ncbi:MAG: hypothetical protein KBC58_01235 [Flavobacterium sp.]|nr:hypothetical protein [Flavobacterium sp.]
MKHIFTLLTLFTLSSLFAVDRFVDPNLSAGNGTTLFTNITSAITAAVNGDRIIVASNTYNEAALTIGKSLQIMPQTSGTTINFNANITIAGFPGMKLEITGFNLGIYSFSSSPITSGSYSNRAKISIINCFSTNLEINNDFYESNIIKNTISNDITIKYGNVAINNCGSIKLMDEALSNQSNLEKNLIVANVVTSIIVYNDDFKVVVANNSLTSLILKRWNPNPNLKNYVINNTFSNNSNLLVSYINVPYYNIVVSSNEFLGTNVSSFGFQCNTNCNIGCYTSEIFSNQCNFGGQYPSQFPNPTISGFFEWTYNGIDLDCTIPTAGNPLVLTKIIGSTTAVNGGNPNHNFYDIDLTINDRGVNGGPYSQLNYNATNSNNSKAFIFDLDMPSDLFPGQNVEIKAKGYHKN